VHILLPPSETKTAGGRGRPVDSRPLSGPLAEPRKLILGALATLLDADPAEAAAALALPGGVADEALAVNREVSASRTTAALRRYSGVVYHGLGFDELSPQVQRLAGRSVLIFSGLWGVLRGDEPVPAYRVPAKAVLPGIGVAGTFWRPRLEEMLPELLGRGAVVDLRSSDYAAMWRPRGTLADRVIAVRVLSPLPRGGYGVISYNSKLAKGRLAAALLARAAGGTPCRGPDDVVAAWLDAGGHGAEPGTHPGRLDLLGD
jgi:uncharacterized protein